MKNATYYLLLTAAVLVYFSASKLLFDRVYETSKIIVDELFHVPQGLAYCNNNFTYWDPKITTLPGLYLVSASIVSSFFECNDYNLRFVNLVASCINICLFASVLKFVYGHNGESNVKIVLQAFNLAILPPLYFFSHLYYTDTLSLTFLLVFFRLCLVNKYKCFILLSGFFSILMRQTNVVWVAMVLGHKALDILVRSSRAYGNTSINRPQSYLLNNQKYMQEIDKSKLKRYYDIFDLFAALKFHVTNCLKPFYNSLTGQDLMIFATHAWILGTFVTFVVWNGSIVVGDKTAHTATLHLPQLLYFLLFYGLFALPYVLNKFVSTLEFIFKHKIVVVGISIVLFLIVQYNTIIHPYILADNRHYTFYVWNRWFNKYWFANYATVPAYVFLMFSLYDNLKDQNCVSFLFPYTICAFAVLALQRMIEVRYFLIPYLVLRLRFVRPSLKMVAAEMILYLGLNAATYYVFFTKEIMWSDFNVVQRIIW